MYLRYFFGAKFFFKRFLSSSIPFFNSFSSSWLAKQIKVFARRRFFSLYLSQKYEKTFCKLSLITLISFSLGQSFSRKFLINFIVIKKSSLKFSKTASLFEIFAIIFAKCCNIPMFILLSYSKQSLISYLFLSFPSLLSKNHKIGSNILSYSSFNNFFKLFASIFSFKELKISVIPSFKYSNISVIAFLIGSKYLFNFSQFSVVK